MIIQDGLPPRERVCALVVIILGIVMVVLDGTIVNLALPDIARELNASAAQFLESNGARAPLVALWLAAGFAAVAGVCSALRIRQS